MSRPPWIATRFLNQSHLLSRMDSSKQPVSKVYTNSQKVRMCRLFLLAPVACVILVCFILLVTMRLIPQMQEVDAGDSIGDCAVINCTAKYENDTSYEKLCSGINETELFRLERARCLQIVFRYTTDDVDIRRPVSSLSKRVEKTCTFCDKKPSNKSENTRLEGLIYYLEKWRNGAGFRCVVRDYEKAKPDMCPSTENNKGEQRMEKNTKVVCLWLSAFLPLCLVAILFMSLFTSRLIKICCHLCYDEEA